MKKKQTKIRFTWITVWLVAAALAFLSFVGYAAYTGVTSVKRVVSTKAGVGILFSSNYMKQGTTAQVSIEYHSPDEFAAGTNPSYNMIVCNFSQSDRATWYTANDLRYNLTATLYLNEKYTESDGVAASLIGHYKQPTAADINGKQFGIKFSEDASYTYFSADHLTVTLPASSTYTLSKNEASTDMFNVLFDRSELQNDAPRFWIYVQATPTSVSDVEIETMSGYIGTCKNATIGANWTGYIEDEGYSTVDYDAYNYIITGSGKGAFYFAWNDDKVKPNEFALLNYASDIAAAPATVSSWANYKRYGTTAPSDGTWKWKYIRLNVDSDETARYEIQLYKTGGGNYSSAIAGYTDYYFVAEQAVTP